MIVSDEHRGDAAELGLFKHKRTLLNFSCLQLEPRLLSHFEGIRSLVLYLEAVGLLTAQQVPRNWLSVPQQTLAPIYALAK